MNNNENTAPAPAKLDTIAFTFVEGSINLDGVTVYTWQAANALLGAIWTGNGATPGYYKSEVIITWADGETVTIRHDVDGAVNNLADTLRGILAWNVANGFRVASEVQDWMAAREL